MNEDEILEMTDAADPVEDLMTENVSGEDLQEVYTEFLEVTQDDTHYFMTTHLDDYTVTEGLLLMILLVLVFRWIGAAIKEGFYWLL